jgi:Protein of unknown function (DUF3788)
MEHPILNDKNQFPTEEILFAHLGKNKSLWIDLFRHIHQIYPDFAEEWRYYNDGKSWLLKVTRKKKTICWISILKNAFRMTCYFSDKAEKIILESELSEEYKRLFVEGKNYGKIRGLTILFGKKEDLAMAKILLSVKEKLK